jgi:hypothetical protein
MKVWKCTGKNRDREIECYQKGRSRSSWYIVEKVFKKILHCRKFFSFCFQPAHWIFGKIEAFPPPPKKNLSI